MSRLMSHPRPALAAAMAAAALAAAAAPAGAAYVLVDDLESYAPGELDGLGDFSTRPSSADGINVVDTMSASGNVVQTGPFSFAQAFFNDNAAFAVGQDSPATFFFQLNLPALSGTQTYDVSYGAGTTPANGFDFEAFDAQFRVTGTGRVTARNGGAFTDTLTTLMPDTLYDVYLAVDTAANTYDIYLTDGFTDATAADLIAEDLALRSPTAGGITAFLGINGNNTAATQTDNFAVDAGAVNLASPAVPIPEPASAAALAAGVGLLSLRRRRA